jgi:hypothetical protein
MWKSVYDQFLQAMAVRWSQYMQINQSAGKAVRDNFQNKIYSEIGIYLIAVPLVFSIIYYQYLNRRFGRYYRCSSWFLTMGICSVMVWVVTYIRAKTILAHPYIDVSQQLLWIGIINAIYACFVFFLSALIFKWSSPMGKRTPF